MSEEKPVTIIFVDDTPDLLESISELLVEYGYTVYPFSNGFDAFDSSGKSRSIWC